MAKFPIVSARQDLGFTPSTGVRANIDTRTGEGAVGAAVGQAALAVAGELQERSARRAAIEVKNRKNLDDISSFKATKIREQALLDIEVMKTSIPPEQWEEQTRKIMEENIGSMDGLDFSPQESAKQKLINAGNLIGEQKKSFVSGSRKLKAQAFAAQTDQLVESFRVNGESVEAGRQATEFIASGKNNGVSASEIILNMKAAKEAGLKLRNEDAVDATRNRASVNPEAVKQEMQTELASRKAGEGDPSLEALTDEDLVSVGKYADSAASNQDAAAKEAIELIQEEQLQNINTLIFADKNYQAATDAALASDLEESAKTTLLTTIEARASAAARGVSIKNDRVVEANMYDLSLGIWKGNVSKSDFDKELLKNAHKLDDAAYSRVTASASNTLKSSQAESLSRANTEARNVLVDFKSEDAFAKFISDSIKGLKPDVAKAFEDDAIERRQLQFNSLTQYNAEMRQWIADNPDKVGKEFFQHSQSVKHDYWNRNIEDLRALRKEQEAGFKGEATTGTIRLISPDGTPFDVPVEKKQRFLDNGFTE